MTFTSIILVCGCAEHNAPICYQSVPGSPLPLPPREPGDEATWPLATAQLPEGMCMIFNDTKHRAPSLS